MKRPHEGNWTPEEAEFFRLTGIAPEGVRDDVPGDPSTSAWTADPAATLVNPPPMAAAMPMQQMHTAHVAPTAPMAHVAPHVAPPVAATSSSDEYGGNHGGCDAFAGSNWWPMSMMPMGMPGLPMAMGMQGCGSFGDFFPQEEADEDPLNPDNDPNRFSGKIKVYYETPSGGYGFIDCEAARLKYGRDVYLHSRQISEAKVGEAISFTIVRNAKGEPQARNVMRAEEAMALKAKIQRRERREQEQKRMKHQTLERAVVPDLRGSVMSEEEAKRFQESLKKKRM